MPAAKADSTCWMAEKSSKLSSRYCSKSSDIVSPPVLSSPSPAPFLLRLAGLPRCYTQARGGAPLDGLRLETAKIELKVTVESKRDATYLSARSIGTVGRPLPSEAGSSSGQAAVHDLLEPRRAVMMEGKVTDRGCRRSEGRSVVSTSCLHQPEDPCLGSICRLFAMHKVLLVPQDACYSVHGREVSTSRGPP